VVQVEVLSTHKELVCLALRELHAVSRRQNPILLSLTRRGHNWVGCRFRLSRIYHSLRDLKHKVVSRLIKHLWLPNAGVTLVTHCDDIVHIRVTDHLHCVNWVIVAILRQAALLPRLGAIASIVPTDRLFLGTNVPNKDVARCC
jgi:hypothetical protein